MFTGPNIVTEGLVLTLDAGNSKSYPGSGTTWTDLSGNGNNGTLTNGPTFNSDNGGSLVFDGVNDYVGVLHSSLLNLGNQFTILTFVKILNLTQTNHIFSTRDITPPSVYTEGYGIYYKYGSSYGINTNTIALQYGKNSWAWNVFGSNGLNITDTNYHFVAVTASSLNTNSPLITFYLDNDTILATNWNVNNPTPIRYSSTINSIRIGSTYTVSSPSYSEGYGNIIMNQLSIYNRALTPQEVQQNYNATKSRFGL